MQDDLLCAWPDCYFHFLHQTLSRSSHLNLQIRQFPQWCLLSNYSCIYSSWWKEGASLPSLVRWVTSKADISLVDLISAGIWDSSVNDVSWQSFPRVCNVLTVSLGMNSRVESILVKINKLLIFVCFHLKRYTSTGKMLNDCIFPLKISPEKKFLNS